MEVHMQMFHNEKLSNEENAKIEKELDSTPAQDLNEAEAWAEEKDEETEVSNSTPFAPYALPLI